MVQVSTSLRFDEDADIKRSATWLTNSSRRRWCNSTFSRVAWIATWLNRPANVLVSERSRLDQVRP